VVSDLELKKTVPIPNRQAPVERVEPALRLHRHEAMAFVASFKLVIRQFALSPTKDARCCWATAVAGLRSERFNAARRLCASCCLMALNEDPDTAEEYPGFRESGSFLPQCWPANSHITALAGDSAWHPSAGRVILARMINLNLSGSFGQSAGNSEFAVLRIELEGIHPTIWRSVIIPKSANLGWVHAVIQVSMGWTNSHLHQFRLGDQILSDPTFKMNEFEDDPPVTDENTLTVGQVVQGKTSGLVYEYDFGDSWSHLLTFSEASEGQAAVENRAVCLEGSRACPPEDCGGSPGYEDLLEALGNKKHPEHRAMKQWLGRPYDPEAFAVDKVNRCLAKLPWPKVGVPQLGKVLAALHRAKA
jgi:hypothetical protein